MAAGTAANAARKQARDRAAALLDAHDAERRRLEAERRKRVTENAAEIAGNDAEVASLTSRIEELHRDTASRLAAIVADGVTEAQSAEMTGRETREVKAAVKTATARQGPRKKPPSVRTRADDPAAA